MEGKDPFKEPKESARASPFASFSLSTGPTRQTMEKKKEFDRRVMSLTKEFQDLNRGGTKPFLVSEDFESFFIENGIGNLSRARELFAEFDDAASGQVTKSQYIKKCLQVEDQVVAKINAKVNTVNVLKGRFDDAVKKLAEAKVCQIF